MYSLRCDLGTRSYANQSVCIHKTSHVARDSFLKQIREPSLITAGLCFALVVGYFLFQNDAKLAPPCEDALALGFLQTTRQESVRKPSKKHWLNKTHH